jgi:heptosyltransferase II
MSSRLVILAPNWLGDAVMALPAIRDVRAASNGSLITIAANPSVAPLFRLVEGVDAVTSIQRSRVPAEVPFDAALLLPNSFHAALAAFRAGIPERWGYRGDWRAPLLTRAVPRPPRGHQIDYYQHLTQALGFPRGDSEPRLVLGERVRSVGVRALVQAGWNGREPLVIFAPGAAYGGAKRWPPEYFADLAAAFAADGITVAMVGSAADAATGAEVETALAGRARLLNLIGSTDLETLCGVLAASRTLVTNDSGAMHVAAALRVPVTAVFGPTRERETGPRNIDPARPIHAVLVNDVWCRPCMERECPLDHRCMLGVTPAAVLDSARRVL